jgi:hypothetical protein
VARPGEITAIDVLPLHEIQAVIEMNDVTEATLKSIQSLNSTSGVFYRPKSFVTERKVDSEATHKLQQPGDEDDALIFSQNSSTSVLQIKTVINSCIAGRAYYLSTRKDQSPEQRRQAIVSDLGAAVAVAQRKAIALSQFQRSQENVRWIQGSVAFQITMAVLITLVSAPPSHNQNCLLPT